MSVRFPRLAAAKATRIIAAREGMSLSELEDLRLPDLETEQFAPTGPPRVSVEYLLSVRERLSLLAREAGYPQRLDLGRFDSAAAVYLAELDLPVGQVIRSDTWAWMTVFLVPHLVQWRWGKANRCASLSRYSGILQRNALGRLWFRAYVMREPGEAPWSTLQLVNEDAHVAILERTSISRDHRLARAIVAAWHERGRGEDALRDAMVRIRVELLLRDVSELSDASLRDLILSAF